MGFSLGISRNRAAHSRRFGRKTLVMMVLSCGGIAVAAAAQDRAAVPSDTLSAHPITQTLAIPAEPGTAPVWDRTPAGVDGLYRVSGHNTPSGFDVPRFVSLKFGKVNARTGPSRDHAIAYQYQRRGLPVVVIAETEMWRKVRDIHGDEAWVRKPALSGDRFAVTLSEMVVRAKPRLDSRAAARIEIGAIVELGDCTDDNFCRVRTANGLTGWAQRDYLWGAQAVR